MNAHPAFTGNVSFSEQMDNNNIIFQLHSQTVAVADLLLPNMHLCRSTIAACTFAMVYKTLAGLQQHRLLQVRLD